MIPYLYLSANWFLEKQMMFIYGRVKVDVSGFDNAQEYGVEKKVQRALRIRHK